MTFNYVAIPTGMTNMTTINTTQLIFKPSMQLGNDMFNLRSVVTINPLFGGQLSTGCSALITMPAMTITSVASDQYFLYSPIDASNMVQNRAGDWVASNVLIPIPEYGSPTKLGFMDWAQQYGTVFVYTTD
jgi:hypothetical protein